jgi:hypothetical protein
MNTAGSSLFLIRGYDSWWAGLGDRDRIVRMVELHKSSGDKATKMTGVPQRRSSQRPNRHCSRPPIVRAEPMPQVVGLLNSGPLCSGHQNADVGVTGTGQNGRR